MIFLTLILTKKKKLLRFYPIEEIVVKRACGNSVTPYVKTICTCTVE